MTESGQTFLIWESEYDADSEDEAEAHHQLVGQIYKTGIDGLKNLFAQRQK